jgi:AcrR family transcriptional regulator
VADKITDRRVQRTRRLLHKALMCLILEKKYESITVQEILDRADVGRSTFYMHFQDKDELLFSGFQYLQRFLESVQEASVTVPGKSYERIIGFSLAMFEHAHEYRRVLAGTETGIAKPEARQCTHLTRPLEPLSRLHIHLGADVVAKLQESTVA